MKQIKSHIFLIVLMVLVTIIFFTSCGTSDSSQALTEMETALNTFLEQDYAAYKFEDSNYGTGIVYFLKKENVTWLQQIPRENGLQENMVFAGEKYSRAAFSGEQDWQKTGEANDKTAMPGVGELRSLLKPELWQLSSSENETYTFDLSSKGKKQLRQKEIDGAKAMVEATKDSELEESTKLLLAYSKESFYMDGTLKAEIRDGVLISLCWRFTTQRPQFSVNSAGKQIVSKQTEQVENNYAFEPLELSEGEIQKVLDEAVSSIQ